MLVSEHNSHTNLIFLYLNTEVLTLTLVILEGSKTWKYMCIVHCISLLFTHKFRQCCTLQTPPVKHLPKLRSFNYSAVTRAKLANKPTAKQALLQYNLEGQTQYSKASSIKLTLMVNLYQQHIKSHLPLAFHIATAHPIS